MIKSEDETRKFCSWVPDETIWGTGSEVYLVCDVRLSTPEVHAYKGERESLREREREGERGREKES